MKCPVCDTDFEEIHCLANCENVCDNCCKHEAFCQDCRYFNGFNMSCKK